MAHGALETRRGFAVVSIEGAGLERLLSALTPRSWAGHTQFWRQILGEHFR
jgi:hypothetical protein